jgi:DNA-directed RNA polymerase subunit RPC12/RpoP
MRDTKGEKMMFLFNATCKYCGSGNITSESTSKKDLNGHGILEERVFKCNKCSQYFSYKKYRPYSPFIPNSEWS